MSDKPPSHGDRCPDDPACPHRDRCALATLLAHLDADDAPDWSLDDMAYVLRLSTDRLREDWLAREFVARSHEHGKRITVPHSEARPYLLRMLGRRRHPQPVLHDRRSGLERRSSPLRGPLMRRLGQDDGVPWTTGEAAAVFGCTRETIRAWVVLGFFPGVERRRRGWTHLPHAAVRACARRKNLLEQ